jgi:hypothetical protein
MIRSCAGIGTLKKTAETLAKTLFHRKIKMLCKLHIDMARLPYLMPTLKTTNVDAPNMCKPQGYSITCSYAHHSI